MEMQRLHKNQRKHLKPRKANVQCSKSKRSVERFSCFVHVVVFLDDHIACAVLFPRHVISTKQKVESSKSLRPNAKLCTFLEVYGVGKCMCSYSIDINTSHKVYAPHPIATLCSFLRIATLVVFGVIPVVFVKFDFLHKEIYHLF